MSKQELLVILAHELPSESPEVIFDLVDDLVELASEHEQIQETLCNHPTDEIEERDQQVENKITDLLSFHNILPIFSGDPRGATVKLKMPSGYTNDSGRTGVVVPIEESNQESNWHYIGV